MYLISFYVPEDHLETVKLALFNKGAGKMGNYDACAWQTPGQGQFRPLAGSTPFLGVTDTIETVPEFKVEMVCDAACLQSVLEELLAVHPYETPAHHAVRVKTLPDLM